MRAGARTVRPDPTTRRKVAFAMPDQTSDLSAARDAARESMQAAVTAYLARETQLSTELSSVKAERQAMEKTLATFDAPPRKRRGRPPKAVTNTATPAAA